MRTKQQRIEAKRLLKKPAGKFEQIDLASNPNHPKWMTRAYINNRYVVMIDDNAQMTGGIVATKAMVQRHDDKPIPGHWREMQNIKNTIFGAEVTAIEYYPPERELTDMANIYWLWILPDEILPRYRVGCGTGEVGQNTDDRTAMAGHTPANLQPFEKRGSLACL